MKFKSLSFRLLVSAGVVLAAFFALVAIVLEQGYRQSAEQALQSTLRIQVYALLSAAEMSKSGRIKMPKILREPRFINPGSGLYACIQKAGGDVQWRSPSSIGLNLSNAPKMTSGEYLFLLDDQGRYVLHYDVIWENETGKEQEYVFSVAEDSQFVTKQVDRFRTTLRSLLTLIGLVLILFQFAVLRWSLKPLRLIVKDLEAIERGEKMRLDGFYATELQGLAGNLNALVSSERAHLERYRNTLADLAHSLKTPLAILRGWVDSSQVNRQTVQDQISRMDEIVEYQLQRAAAKGEKKITGTVDVSVVIDKIIASMHKVYADKAIHFEIEKPDNFKVYCEQGDIYEIAGNLIDNACKWCDSNIKVSLSNKSQTRQNDFALVLQVEDDGPGIPADHLQNILKRGVRADQNTHGHGIGMAVVNELIELLGGRLVGDKSEVLGGMRWQVYLP
ncbi:MAG: sensor histidine kinase [Gammaproteobacteria bacterium HGW-Gammaproteobacteria-3]|nr:MAG: sensor histidine kinase [Gammaproteobacteria bacterium HGW-Gammaproteobacteria-3]